MVIATIFAVSIRPRLLVSVSVVPDHSFIKNEFINRGKVFTRRNIAGKSK